MRCQRTAHAAVAAVVLLALSSCGRGTWEQVVEKRIGQLERGDEEVRSYAAWALGQLGERAKPAVPALARALADPSPKVRAAAASALFDLGDDAAPAVPALIRSLDDPEDEVASGAAKALGQIGEPAAVPAIPALLAALGSRSADVRAFSAWALGEIPSDPSGRKPVEDALIRAMQDPDERVGSWSAEALLKVRGVRGVKKD